MSAAPQGFGRFFTGNLLKGVLAFALFLVGFLLLRDWILGHYEQWLEPIADDPFWLYVFFFLNELIFGFVPPEVLMVIFLPKGTAYFIQQLIVMTILSYLGGFSAYGIGLFFQRFPQLDFVHRFEWLARLQPYYSKYGGWLIFAAAVTPLPFALVSLLSGWLKFPVYRYLLFGSLRFMRFAVYGYLLWLANSVF